MKKYIFLLVATTTVLASSSLLNIREEISTYINEINEYSEDFVDISQRLEMGTLDEDIAWEFADNAGDCCDYLIFAKDLIDIFCVINSPTDRISVKYFMNKSKNNMVEKLEIKIKYVNDVLPLIKNEYLAIRGNELRKKMKEVVKKLESFDFH